MVSYALNTKKQLLSLIAHLMSLLWPDRPSNNIKTKWWRHFNVTTFCSKCLVMWYDWILIIMFIVCGFELQVNFFSFQLIACGSTFTFAGVQETSRQGTTINSVYFWGTRPKFRRNRAVSSSDSYSAGRSTRGRRISTVDEDSISDGDFTSRLLTLLS